MAVSLESLAWMILAGALWGLTGPFLRRAAKNRIDVTHEGERRSRTSSKKGIEQRKFIFIIKWLGGTLYSLFTDLPYLIPFAINQSGSIAFMVALSRNPLHVTVPVVNGLNILFTLLAGWALGEDVPWKSGKPSQVAMYKSLARQLLGIGLILAGTTICVM